MYKSSPFNVQNIVIAGLVILLLFQFTSHHKSIPTLETPAWLDSETAAEYIYEHTSHITQDREPSPAKNLDYVVQEKPVPAAAAHIMKKAKTTEVVAHEIKHRTTIVDASAAKYLVCVITQGKSSWGNGRTVNDFVEMLNTTSGLPLSAMSLALLVTSETYYYALKEELAGLPFAKTQVILYRSNEHLERPEDRHAGEFQLARRRMLAMTRNVLMTRALAEEEHIVWWDSDIVNSDHGLMAKMIEQSGKDIAASTQETRADLSAQLPVGLITARTSIGGEDNNYDLNAYVGKRPGHARAIPTCEEEKARRKGEYFWGRGSDEIQYIDTVIEGTSNDDLIMLESVGATVLYIRSSLVRMGLMFPMYSMIGTSWDMPNGWDGIESEGLCYVARTLGQSCYTLGGSWHVSHG